MVAAQSLLPLGDVSKFRHESRQGCEMAATGDEKAGGAGKLIAVFAVVAVIGLVALAQQSTPSTTTQLPVGGAVISSAPAAPPALEAADAALAENTTSTAPAYAPPSSTQVDKAVSEGVRVYKAEGLSGLSHYGQQCYETLLAAPTYKGLDFCLAFDEFSTTVAQSVDSALTRTPGSYFAKHEQRALAAGEVVMNGAADAGARLVDVRTLVSNAVAERAGRIDASSDAPPAGSELVPQSAESPN